mgnify:CR=1 FL=1
MRNERVAELQPTFTQSLQSRPVAQTGSTDAEIERGFEIARALGAGFITASSTLSSAKRVAPFAETMTRIGRERGWPSRLPSFPFGPCG